MFINYLETDLLILLMDIDSLRKTGFQIKLKPDI